MKFKNKYRIESIRLPSWDYGSNGRYFITICTKNRINFFGFIKNGIMNLNEIGKIADGYWLEIPNHFNCVSLGNHIVMPNHIHGIIIINKPKTTVETGHCPVSTPMPIPIPTPMPIPMPTPTITPANNENSIHFRFRNQGKNTLSSIVGSFKSITTRTVKKTHPDFDWQARFHDHIIRSQHEFVIISRYIKNNPANWRNDAFNT